MKAKELAQQEGITVAAAQKRLQRAKSGQQVDKVDAMISSNGQKVDKMDKQKVDCLEAERLLWGKISHLEFMIDELQTRVALLGQPQPEVQMRTGSNYSGSQSGLDRNHDWGA